MQAYDDSWIPFAPEGLTTGRDNGLGGLHAVTLPTDAGSVSGSADLGSDLMAFLSDFRAAQYEPAPTAGASPAETDPVGGAAGAVPAPAGGAAAPAGASIHWIGGPRPAEEEYYDPYEGRPAPAGPGWWQASDHLWYAPELHPDAQVVAEPAPAPAPPEELTAPLDPVAFPGAGPVAAAAEDDSDRSRGRLRLGRLGRKG